MHEMAAMAELPGHERPTILDSLGRVLAFRRYKGVALVEVIFSFQLLKA